MSEAESEDGVDKEELKTSHSVCRMTREVVRNLNMYPICIQYESRVLYCEIFGTIFSTKLNNSS
jgi:hypothetical protein